jgi:hypothetical protein
VIKYVQSNKELSVDRNASGNTSYDLLLAVSTQPLSRPMQMVRCNCEYWLMNAPLRFMGGQGEAVISDLIFPYISSDGFALSTSAGNVVLESVDVRPISL